MKIAHLSSYTAQGGAGIATVRIHKKLLERGIKSDLLVLNSSNSNIQCVTEVKKGFFYRVREFIFYRLDNYLFRRHLKKNSLPFSFNFFRRISINQHPII